MKRRNFPKQHEKLVSVVVKDSFKMVKKPIERNPEITYPSKLQIILI